MRQVCGYGLVWAILLTPVVLLKLALSFNDLDITMTSWTLQSLVMAALENADNLPTISRLAHYGDHGLRETISISCNWWSLTTLRNVLHHCRYNYEIQLVYLTFYCNQALRGRPSLLKELREEDWQGILISPQLSSSFLQDLKRYEQMEPRGFWWPEYDPNFCWNSIEACWHPFINSPLLRVGLLDALDSFVKPSSLLNVYTEGLTMVSGDLFRSTERIYGLIRVCATIDQSASECAASPCPHKDVASVLRRFLLKYQNLSAFAALIRVITLWLIVFTGEEIGDAPKVILASMMDGPLAIEFESHPVALMSALLVIVYRSSTFDHQARRVLIDRFRIALQGLDDFDLSAFLWHAYFMHPCQTDSSCVERMVKDPSIRRRLLHVPPIRGERWISLLLSTSFGISYFRRWQATYISASQFHDLLLSRDSGLLFETIALLPWKTVVPWTSLMGRPGIKELKGLLKVILTEPDAPFRLYDFSTLNRTWVDLVIPCNADENITSAALMALQLILRLRLHYEETEDLVDPHSQGITYDLCRETVEILRQPDWRRRFSYIQIPLNIVYPWWPGEDARSRVCGT